MPWLLLAERPSGAGRGRQGKAVGPLGLSSLPAWPGWPGAQRPGSARLDAARHADLQCTLLSSTPRSQKHPQPSC